MMRVSHSEGVQTFVGKVLEERVFLGVDLVAFSEDCSPQQARR